MVDRTHRDLSDKEVARIAGTYHAWRGEKAAGMYQPVLGFCKSARTEEIAAHGYVLTPGRYVGAQDDQEEGGEPFAEKMARLKSELEEQFVDATRLDEAIRKNLAFIENEN